ncbi:hypothetical protein BKA58DRAFT_350775 [Alternaria rosae]|uniref:uncharacterized protein n=1 Tax=Alternaria rosae TaxID=1187941 RepID=UPI001E8DCE94|nr:uncharacterized protein BKA58DRAFT_350775 [Alternaria rosae]KAH6882138.1 hypothetical protein BKA58DRAFT_350775 [Alternaria rosae]
MPPKRKKTGKGDDPPKAKKTRSEDTPDDDITTTAVNWIIPKEKGKDVYQEKCAAEFAQALYQRARDEIRPQQTPMSVPQFRTPVFQKKGNDLRAEDKYRPSASLRNLFNDIKSRSIHQEEGHSITHFQQQFGGDANIAVVLSRAENYASFALNEDQRLEVTVNDITAHVDFIQRDSSEDGSAVGYFIELPRNTSVTVNGTTYTNSDGPSSLSFYIGPLEGYAVIELLSQPAFFFRTAASLKDTSSHRAATQEELDRRDGNGDVALGNTRVRWSPIEAPLPGAGLGSAGVPGKAEGGSEDDFIDTFTDEGEPIKDTCAYMRAQLLSLQQNRYRELVPRVLASVNDRQKEATGFSYQHQGQTCRPGRTLLVPMEMKGNHLLLAAQIHPDKHITLEVLDPLTWQATLSSRKGVDEHIRETLRNSTWWRHVYDSLDHMEGNLPEATMWVPAAQVTTADGSFTYTVLNAWALAMGLVPNPSFTPSAHGHESFFIRAQQIFDLALQDTLNWRILLAFFRCTGFVKPGEGGENDEEANLPHLSRRFDLCNCSFQKLITRQATADTGAEGKKIDMELVTLGLEDKTRHDVAFAADSLEKRDRKHMAFMVRYGQWNFADTEKKLERRLEEHKEKRMSDLSLPPQQARSTRDTEKIPVDFDPCKHLHEQLKSLEDQRKIEPRAGSELGEAMPSKLESRHVFGHIESVARAINELLSPERPEQGFTVADLNGHTRYADDSGILDTVVIKVCQLGEHVILVVSQHEDTSKKAPDVSRVMDSAPWTATAKERVRVHELLQDAGKSKINPDSPKERSIVGPVLQWMPSPQQARVEEAGYFAIMSAWAVLLGLPIDPKFRIGAKFYDSALPLLQAVGNAHADWRLIWAFLRCVGYTQSELPPPMQRRFKATKPAHGPRNTRTDRKKKRSIDAQASRDINYSHFQVNTGVAHTEVFPWDDYNEPDRAIRIPELINPGPEKNTETAGKPEKEKSVLPGDFDPCKYFDQQRNALLNDPAVAAAVESLRTRATTTFGLWLTDEEVSLAIAAVTLGITNAQGLEGGFGCLNQTAVQYCQYPNPTLMQPTIRPGRPLVVPVNLDGHIILVVIQFDGSKEEPTPTISILDSKSHNYSFEQRARVFDTARNMLIASRWGRFPNMPDADDFRQYTREALHAEWIPVAPQPTDDECGYYAILNAWALALGLQPNINFFPSWTAQFFQDLVDVIHIARVGRADWRLIYAFLGCKDFIGNAAAVPEDHYFEQTENLLSEDALQSVLDRLEESERRDWEGRDPDFSKLAQANRTHVVPGKRHDMAWPSDDWTKEARKEYVKDLERWGKLVLDVDSKELKAQWQEHLLMHGAKFENQLKHIHGELKGRTLDITKDILPHYKGFLNKLHPPGLNLQIDHYPCSWVTDAVNIYDCILNYDPLGPSFSNGMREEVNRQESGRLGWSSHRNTAQIGGSHHRYPVPEQQEGGFQCGYHVFVNAWILAMGLTPDIKRGPYDEDVYFEAWIFARAAIAGLLDWKALVAWFFCRKLTVQRTNEDVPANRRFEGTVPQVPDRLDPFPEAVGEGELRDHVQQRYDADDRPLALLSVEDAPYDRSNNIVWPPSKGKEQNDQGESLDRSYDDTDLDFFEAQAGIKRKSREEIDDGLCRFYSSHATGDTRTRDTVHSSFSGKKQRLSDSLSFLDRY